MTRTEAVDRPDFHAWRAYRAIVEAETAAEQVAVFRFQSEGRARVGVWIHGGPSNGIRIGAVLTTASEFIDPVTGAFRKGHTYTAVADARLPNGTFSRASPIVKGLHSRQAAAALLYGRWIERRGRHR
jgi:hypothetical protein